jgi:hypothetical protein
VAVGGDQDAPGAKVEVGQAGGVGRLQGVEQLEAELGHPADRERAMPGDQLVEGEGVDQLGGHIDDTILHDDVVQPDQAGMIQRGRGPRLARDPVPEPRRPPASGDMVEGKRYDRRRTWPKTACEQAVCWHDTEVTRW